MFDLSCEEQQQARATKLVQCIKDIATKLGVDKLMEPTTLVNIHNVICKTFGNWARKVNPDGDGEKVFAYNDIHILQEISCTWSRLHEVIAVPPGKEMKVSA